VVAVLLLGAFLGGARGCGVGVDVGDASVSDASVSDASVADASVGESDGLSLTVADDSPLAFCPGRSSVPDHPQVGLCGAGFFPDLDYGCGPPSRGPDAGWECSCRRTGDGTCLKRCTGDGGCGAGEACILSSLFWGSDVSTHTVSLSRSR
jgi:hypothetical protein